jgi:hypothetical protein
MYKNIVIVILVLVVAVETGYIVMKRGSWYLPATRQGTGQAGAVPSGTPPSGAPKPMMAGKGQKLADSPLAKYAFQIVPGPMSDAATTAMVGFSAKLLTLADGSTQVDLTPKDSDDQYQRYVVKKGEILYFVEMTPADDKADSDRDLNYRDDYGIITDVNGIIQ